MPPAKKKKRKIIVSIATSADGFIARPDGSVDWLDRPYPPDFYGMASFFKSIDTILWGRKTYEVALGFQKEGKEGSQFDAQIKNYVFSRQPPPRSTPGVKFVTGPIREFAKRLRATPGKDIWIMGGGGLIASFLDDGEIDEFIISVIPTFIGEGIPLIAPHHRTVELKLLATKAWPDGVVKLHYVVLPPGAAKRSSKKRKIKGGKK